MPEKLYQWRLACTDDTIQSYRARRVCVTKQYGIQRMKDLNNQARQHRQKVRWFLVNKDIVELMYACGEKV